MKLFKFGSIALLAALMVCAITPELSAGNHRNRHRNYNKNVHKTVNKTVKHKYSSSGSFFGFNLNLNPTPNYVEQVTYVQPQPVYYYPQYEQVVVQQPMTYSYYTAPSYYSSSRYYSSPQVYVQPQFSYWNYW